MAEKAPKEDPKPAPPAPIVDLVVETDPMFGRRSLVAVRADGTKKKVLDL